MTPESGRRRPRSDGYLLAQAARVIAVRLVFAFVVWQGVLEITAILGPLLPSITTDVETCHPPVELSPITQRATRSSQGYRRVPTSVMCVLPGCRPDHPSVDPDDADTATTRQRIPRRQHWHA